MNTEFLFAGRATLTVEASLASQQRGHRPHYTYRVERGKRLGFVVGFMVGSDNAKASSYRYLGTLRTDGVFTSPRPDSQEARTFRVAVAAVFGGRAAIDHVEQAGWKLHHAGLCGRCGKLLTNPASIETGIGPECELYVRLGLDPDEVPCVADAEVARLQLAYWMNGDDGVILDALRDAAEERLGFDADRADLYVEATRRLMRRHKKGAALSEAFLKAAGV